MISVCMATYNGERFIKEQIDSILMQIGPNDEIVISDDHSTDNTLKIISSYNDKRIKLINNPNVRSVSYNFLNSLKNAKGDYIFLSDQDDIWMPQKIQIILENLINYDLVVHDAKVIDSKGNILNNSAHQNARVNFVYNLISNRTFSGCCMAFRRSILSFCLPFPPSFIMYDHWIALCALTLGLRVKYIENKLILYRRHFDNNSFFKKSKNNFFTKIKYRLVMIYYIFKNILRHYKKAKKYINEISAKLN